MLTEKKLTYCEDPHFPGSKILTMVDGHLNPCLFVHDYSTPRTREQQEKDAQEEKEREETFKETYRKLYSSAKHVTITFADGHVAVLNLNDKQYGPRIKWLTRDLLSEVVIPKKLGFNKYGQITKKPVGILGSR